MTTPTTITRLRSTLLRVPWRGAPPAAGVVPPGPPTPPGSELRKGRRAA